MARTKQSQVERLKEKLAQAKLKRKEDELKAGAKKNKALKAVNGTKAAAKSAAKKMASKSMIATASTKTTAPTNKSHVILSPIDKLSAKKKTPAIHGAPSAAIVPVKGSSFKKPKKQISTLNALGQPMVAKRHQNLNRKTAEEMISRGQIRNMSKTGGVKRLHNFVDVVREECVNYMRPILGKTFILADYTRHMTLTPAHLRHVLAQRNEQIYYGGCK